MYVDDFQKYPGWFSTSELRPVYTVWYQLAPYLGFGEPSQTLASSWPVSRERNMCHCPAAPAVNMNFLGLGGAANYRYLPGYGYNAYGTKRDGGTQVALGLCPEVDLSDTLHEICATDVRVPSEMVAWGDVEQTSPPFLPLAVDPYCRTNETTIVSTLSARHTEAANAVFCDAHVEHAKLFKWTAPINEARCRWNNDHAGHRETWER